MTSKIKSIERGLKVPAYKIHPNPWNPNKTTNRQRQAIAESLQEYSQVLEIIVRPHPEKPGEYQVVDGEHRLDELEGDVYVNVLHGLEDADAKKLTIILNETRGQADRIELSGLLKEIQLDMGEELGLALPYEPIELEGLLSLSEIDWESYQGGGKGEDNGGDEEKEEWVTISVKVSQSAYDVIKQAKDLISEEDSLHKDKAIAWGQVVERLSADYLGK
jgi:hypothetical protein